MTDERSSTNIPTTDPGRKDQEPGPRLSRDQAKLTLISLVDAFGVDTVALWVHNIREGLRK